MKHAREDYNRIIDPSGKIPENEPVFLLRGHDKLAPFIVRVYADLNDLMGGKEDISRRLRYWAIEMEKWQQETGISKLADLPNQ
jgi:hypothetical protein